MTPCRITFAGGVTADVAGPLQAVIDELHKVSTRREHTFAVLEQAGGGPIALRPEAVVHIRPLEPDSSPPG